MHSVIAPPPPQLRLYLQLSYTIYTRMFILQFIFTFYGNRKCGCNIFVTVGENKSKLLFFEFIIYIY